MLRRTSALHLVLAATLVSASLLTAQQPPATPPAGAAAPAPAGRGGGRGAPPVKSPEVAADGRVTFRLRAPNAKEVAVGVRRDALPMQKDEQGVWSVTSDVLDARLLHLFAGRRRHDGQRSGQPAGADLVRLRSVDVRGARPAAVAAGGRRAARRDRAAHFPIRPSPTTIATSSSTRRPATTPRRSRPYPVLYLLHGLGDDAERWMNGGGGQRDPRQPDRPGQGRADGDRDDARLRRRATAPPARWRPRASPATRRAC